MQARRVVAAAGVAVLTVVAGCASSQDETQTEATTGESTASPTPDAADAISLGELTGALEGKDIASPAANTVFACSPPFPSSLVAASTPWADNETGVVDLAAAPRVPGSVTWESEMSVTGTDSERSVTSNGLPSHPTGEFPVPADSEAAQYDRNPNAVEESPIDWTLPIDPESAAEPSCLGGGAIGVMTTGAVLFNSLDADAVVAVAARTVDDCEGHVSPTGEYHYHSWSSCFDQGSAGEHAPLVGYATDGYGIYGPRDADGEIITNADLDDCHGHTGDAPDADGNTESVYHYHINNEFPFVPGCLTAEPAVSTNGGGAAPAVHPPHLPDGSHGIAVSHSEPHDHD